MSSSATSSQTTEEKVQNSRIGELNENKYNELKERKTNYEIHETKVIFNENNKNQIKNSNEKDLDLFVDQEYNQNVIADNNNSESDQQYDDCNDSTECNCFDCEIRRNSDYSTEQLPLDIQMPLSLMSDSLMFCTIL